MRTVIIRRASLVVALTLGALVVSGCAFIFEGNDRTMNPSAEETHEQEIAAAIEAINDTIISARAEQVRSGLGTNLYVTFHVSTEAVTAAELEAVLTTVAPRIPEGMGVVRITARDEGVELIPLNDAAQQLGLPELSIKSEGTVVMNPDTLAKLYAK
ncbi:hypothetical protein C2138_02485 [Salinibacterium hongtaonis]|nr:hypothetical protein C2138_02485 [Salinibacterium hongtaonis]